MTVGSWQACTDGSTSCDWSIRFQPKPGVEMTYSTTDNSLPLQLSASSCSPGEVLIGGECICDRGLELRGSRCALCESGKFKSTAGPGLCMECAQGSFQTSQGATDCARCGEGWYQPYRGSSTGCLSCTLPMSSAPGSATCTICAASTYQALSDEPASTRNCRPCPAAFACSLNTTLADVYVLPGFWRLSARAETAYRCRGASNHSLAALGYTGNTNRLARTGATSPCSGGTVAGRYCSSDKASGALCEV